MQMKVIGIVFFSLLMETSQAQQIDPAYISIADGLASPIVQDVIQDSYGLIWIATTNGIQKYDGYKFETFKNVAGKKTSLQNNNAWGLVEDGHHDIWVASAQGISKYDRKRNEFVNYTFSGKFEISEGGGLTFNIFMDSQQRLWATTQNLEVLFYEPETDEWKFAPYEIPGNNQPNHYGTTLAFTEDLKGGFWTGSSNYGLMHRAKGDDSFRPVSKDQLGGFDFLGKGNSITALFSDAANTLWITTRSGVYKYYPEIAIFKTIKEYDEGQIDVWNNWNSILPDRAGNIWIANNFHGILKFKGISDQFEEISIAGKIRMLSHGWNITLTDFMIDRSGIFWFGTREAGLLKYDPVNKPFSFYTHSDSDPSSLSRNGVFGILASKVKPGIVYVGTRGEGFNIFDPQKQTFQKVTFKVADDMYRGSVRSIAENGDGTLWLGTWGDGLIRLDEQYKEIKRFKYESNTPNTISNNQVRVIKPDRKGKLWVGTNNGLNIYNTKTQGIERVASKSTRSYSKGLVEEIEALSLTDQMLGVIDQVTDAQNLSQPFEVKTGGPLLVMSVGEADVNSLADYGWIESEAKDTVWRFPDFDQSFYAGGAGKNRIIIDKVVLQPGRYVLRYSSDGSHSFGNWNEAPPDQSSLYGILVVRPKDENQTRYFESLLVEGNEKFIISGNSITDIEVAEKYIWIGSSGSGLTRIDQTNDSVTYFVNDPYDIRSLSSDAILDIFEDSRGIIWVATNEGVNVFDSATEKFTRYSESDGLPTNLTEAILEGDNGEMWIATQNGLSQMVTNEALEKVTFINYNSTDGLGGDTFLSLCAARASDGRFYFGGEHGLTAFTSITANNVPPELIISNLLISNKSVLDMGEESPLQENLQEVKAVTLSFDQNNLSFEFSALHFANPAKNQYAHILRGYDRDWIYDNRNFAAYTNLDPGEYEFVTIASNAYGIWNEKGKSIKITILPPWWKTWWAYGMYASLFGLGIVATDRGMRRRIKLKERERTREKELRHAKEIEKAYTNLKETQAQLVQSEKMASLGELTAGIAHEIQNPLNFVNNFAEVNTELIDELQHEMDLGNHEEAKAIAQSLKRNEEKIMQHGKRADAIVKGMLQHSRNSNGIKEPTDINALADEYFRLAYHGLRAKDKSFSATTGTDLDENVGNVNVIPQDIGRVILNLITNAFHAVMEKKKRIGDDFEPTVFLATKRVRGGIEISVKDNGGGIQQDVMDKIFQPFFTTKPTGQGTGLGLSMSYDIVKKGHGGEIKIDTEVGKYAIFTIILPAI